MQTITVENLKEIIGDKECQLFIVRNENLRLRHENELLKNKLAEKKAPPELINNADTSDIPN